MRKLEKFLIKALIIEVITFELWIYGAKRRGYINPGGEILIIPLIFIFRYFYREFKKFMKDSIA